MEDQYTIENLLIIFEKHAIIVDEREKELDAKYPGRDKPPEDFNIARALLTLTKEIAMLQRMNHE